MKLKFVLLICLVIIVTIVKIYKAEYLSDWDAIRFTYILIKVNILIWF